jgi:multidrug efflux pump subunit AcrB
MDMRANGLLDPITLCAGQIIDGRNRYRACAMLGVSPRFTVFEGTDEDALAFVISKNLARRHLNDAQRAMVAESLANMKVGRNWDDNSANLQNKASQADAKKLNVSPRSVATARVVKQTAEQEVVQAIEEGTRSRKISDPAK